MRLGLQHRKNFSHSHRETFPFDRARIGPPPVRSLRQIVPSRHNPQMIETSRAGTIAVKIR